MGDCLAVEQSSLAVSCGTSLHLWKSPTKRSKEGFVGADQFSKLFRNLSLPRPGPKRRLNLMGVVQRNHSWKIIPKTVISIAIVAWLELAKLDHL